MEEAESGIAADALLMLSLLLLLLLLLLSPPATGVPAWIAGRSRADSSTDSAVGVEGALVDAPSRSPLRGVPPLELL